jgi:hypothetical protein
VLTPVIAFYLLADWDRMVATVDSWLPRDHRDTIRSLLHEMDMAIAGFLRGQAGLRAARRLLCHRPQRHRRQFRRADRHHLGLPLLHPLCRLADRARALGRRRDGAVLAGLDLAAGDARVFFGQFLEGTSSSPSSSAIPSACTRSG